MIKKILIANRGEIALRIIRACKELDLKSVTVHSEADNLCLHRKFSDEDICIGPSKSIDTYLNIPRVIAAAVNTGADAIHPGYGFLAENANFSDICRKHHITFIGPTKDMIEQMGDKATARKIMKKAGIPVVPGSEEIISDLDEAKKTAKQIGYPVIIKATAGGGGKGMRIARNEKQLKEYFPIAQSEAMVNFKNPNVYLEKYFDRAKHIEFQILADRFGNVIHLGERDCSIQRRHQKLVEEAPSPIMTPALRQKMGKIVTEGIKKIGYEGAGTIEFLVDDRKNFYFMEMNTRVQVEHPITEEITRVGIIKEQIKVASGDKLSIKQEDVKFTGHSIECRINAEDPDNDFSPFPGEIKSLHFPAGFGVRVDSHLYAGYSVPQYYDSLLAKLIVWGKNRKEAISRMKRSLDETVIEGIKTTIPFHLKVMKHPKFIAGNIHTQFLTELGY